MRQLLIVFFTVLLCMACDPYRNARNGTVSFSADTLYFDTVFSSLGSVTMELRAINRNEGPLLIDRIYLGGGSASPFRLNIDGSPVIEKQDVVLAPGDSIFIFVDVIIDPNGDDSPVSVTDSVVFVSGNTLTRVILEAWGQDIRLLENTVTGSDVWIKGKPYVIYGSLTVDTTAILTLKAGTRVYFHNKAEMTVAGTLVTEGSFDDPVMFASDRTATEYGDVPGQWKGVVFQDCSSGNVLRGTEIRNAEIAVSISGSESGTPDMKISGSRLLHNSVSSLVAAEAVIECDNSVFAHTGFSTVSLSGEGSFDFTFCTLVNRWEYGYRSEPALFIGKRDGILPEVIVINSVITGSQIHEMFIDAAAAEIIGKIYADSSLIKTDTLKSQWWNRNAFTDVQTNAEPRFIDEPGYDYRPDTLSPLLDRAGRGEVLVFPADIRNMVRPTGLAPDIGAFERQPGEKKKDNGF